MNWMKLQGSWRTWPLHRWIECFRNNEAVERKIKRAKMVAEDVPPTAQGEFCPLQPSAMMVYWVKTTSSLAEQLYFFLQFLPSQLNPPPQIKEIKETKASPALPQMPVATTTSNTGKRKKNRHRKHPSMVLRDPTFAPFVKIPWRDIRMSRIAQRIRRITTY